MGRGEAQGQIAVPGRDTWCTRCHRNAASLRTRMSRAILPPSQTSSTTGLGGKGSLSPSAPLNHYYPAHPPKTAVMPQYCLKAAVVLAVSLEHRPVCASASPLVPVLLEKLPCPQVKPTLFLRRQFQPSYYNVIQLAKEN